MGDAAELCPDDARPIAARDADVRRAASRMPTGTAVTARSVTINRPRAELYAFWRDFANLPRFMGGLRSIVVTSDQLSHWVVNSPAGGTVEWDAEITEDVPGESFAWKCTDTAIAVSGRVAFRDAGARGTVVTATLAYDPPGGSVGKLVAKLFGSDPERATRHDLRRFKQLMETGEITTAARNRAAALAERH